ncbi:MAG: hypothetical protein LAT68_03975 [Cyclobacteriaceae bacterium]|nr:hypothetical protein [Cyclobacteriaceae bacterium]MCH8515466.1 hypothetical protein [Cyclobacteriaceae bacterium]
MKHSLLFLIYLLLLTTCTNDEEEVAKITLSLKEEVDLSPFNLELTNIWSQGLKDNYLGIATTAAKKLYIMDIDEHGVVFSIDENTEYGQLPPTQPSDFYVTNEAIYVLYGMSSKIAVFDRSGVIQDIISLQSEYRTDPIGSFFEVNENKFIVGMHYSNRLEKKSPYLGIFNVDGEAASYLGNFPDYYQVSNYLPVQPNFHAHFTQKKVYVLPDADLQGVVIDLQDQSVDSWQPFGDLELDFSVKSLDREDPSLIPQKITSFAKSDQIQAITYYQAEKTADRLKIDYTIFLNDGTKNYTADFVNAYLLRISDSEILVLDVANIEQPKLLKYAYQLD